MLEVILSEDMQIQGTSPGEKKEPVGEEDTQGVILIPAGKVKNKNKNGVNTGPGEARRGEGNN